MDSAEFDKRMAAILESFEKSRIEDERRHAEWERRQAERERESAESKAKWERESAELSRKMAETDKQIDKVDKQIDRVSKQMGGINENIGQHAEQFFQSAFEKKLEFGGIKYDEIICNLAHKDKSGSVEFDIVLENCQSIAVIEVKNRIHPSFVRELAEERIKKFREYFPIYKDYSVYLGIAGFSLCEFVVEEASRYGVGIVRQVGDSMEMDARNLKAY